MDSMTINGLSVAYSLAGSGPPLVLVHGILSDSRFWAPQLESLTDEFAVLAWDAPGAGRSDDPPESIGLAGYADCLAQLIASTGLAPAHIVGLSLGGVIALGLYQRHPESVRSLTLADTYAGWLGSMPAEAAQARLDEAMRDSRAPAEQFLPGWIPQLFSAQAPAALRESTLGIMSEFHPAGYRAMARVLAETDLRDLLPTIDVPCLLIWGIDDRRSPDTVARQFHSAIRGSELSFIAGAGHVSSLEQPEQFNALVRSFVRRLEGLTG